MLKPVLNSTTHLFGALLEVSSTRLINETEIKITGIVVVANSTNVEIYGYANADCYIYAVLSFGEAIYVDTSFVSDQKFKLF